MRQRLVLGVGVVAFLAVLWKAVLLVDPAEVAVVYRFGAPDHTAGAGLSFVLPWVEHAERIRVTEVRRVELQKVKLLTGDTNLVEVSLVAQYSVQDPTAFAVRAEDPEAIVAAEISAAATNLISRVDVDTLLTTGRSAVQQGIQKAAQASLDALGVGVLLVGVEVSDLSPPAAVVNAFNDVSSAKGDQETLRLAADAYASQALPDVRGKAAAMLERATGDAAAQSARADGDIARFEALRESWKKAPGATRVQVRRELAEQIGTQAKVVVVKPGTEVDLP